MTSLSLPIKYAKTDSCQEKSLVTDSNNVDRQSRRLRNKFIPIWILCFIPIIWILSHLVAFRFKHEDDIICPDYEINLYDEYHYKPEQIHLSLGANGTEVFVTWSTRQPTVSKVEYLRSSNEIYLVDGLLTIWTSEEKDPKLIEATRSKYMDHYTYRARLTDIQPDGHYFYRVISNHKLSTESIISSRVYDFYSYNLTDPSRPLSVAFYGDLGLVNGQSIPRLIKDVDSNLYDMIIHNGDFAYDLNTNHGWYGDDFMRAIEPIAARVPYQTSVGNHEVAEFFRHYDQRFTMVNSGGTDDGSRNNFFYSFNAGPIHFVAISTEYYYFIDYIGIQPLTKQWSWLERDLKLANSPAERAIRPWIIVFGHRPMYCSSRDNDDCSKSSNILRRGLPFIGAYALEKLLYRYGVDVQIYAHEHQYERFLPIYDGKVMNGTDEVDDPYLNPLGPVHIISGSAGCQERIDPFTSNPATGSVKQIADYGYTRLKAWKKTLRFQQISDDQNGTVVDEFYITKTRQSFPKN